MRKLFKDVSAAIIILILFKNGKLHGNHHMYVVNTKEVNMSWLVSQLVNVCSVGKALHWNYSSCSSLNFFFLALFSLLLGKSFC